ncbi:MAG: hypothetical protein KatS3mg087_1729 [Patescibacteria group bacterium]|nr:MAG: hypothetical protein KatS3mg087_1729 [Patescibacteria group bacterium]
MPIKGERWFLRKCYNEVRRCGPLAHLADKALQLGLGSENTQGHVKQAVGALQAFLQQYSQHKQVIRQASPVHPFNLTQHTTILNDWLKFFQNCQGAFGPRRQYDYDILRRYLTQKYGGTRQGGGGGDNEFEIVLRLLAEWL